MRVADFTATDRPTWLWLYQAIVFPDNLKGDAGHRSQLMEMLHALEAVGEKKLLPMKDALGRAVLGDDGEPVMNEGWKMLDDGGPVQLKESLFDLLKDCWVTLTKQVGVPLREGCAVDLMLADGFHVVKTAKALPKPEPDAAP